MHTWISIYQCHIILATKLPLRKTSMTKFLLTLHPHKSESHLKKTHKSKLKLVTEVEEPKTSSFVKPRRWNSFIVKFQNLKQIAIIRANQKKINVKNNLKQIKSNFFYRKFWNKSYQNFSTKLLGSWEI